MTILGAIVTGYLTVISGLIPANAGGSPLPFESWAASKSLDATLEPSAPKEPNPVALTDEKFFAGVNL